MNAEEIRYQIDLSLYNKLLKNEDVIRANKLIVDMEEANGGTTEHQRSALNKIAAQVHIPESFVCQSLEYDCEPD